MQMKPPTVTHDYVNAPSYVDLVATLELIRHATAPTSNDGGAHENAYSLADNMLKRVEARQKYEARREAFDTLPDDYECPH